METINPEDLLKLWKEGETLYASLFVYTDESLREKSNTSIKEFENQSKAISKDHPHGALSVTDVLNTFKDTFANYQGYQSANNELKRNLLSKLQLEKVIGLGFEAPIKPSSQPTIIPIHILPNKIYGFDWSESSFSLNGIEFLNIRLIKYSLLKTSKRIPNKKTKITLPKTEIKSNSGGRPTNKETIIKAYELLKSEERIDFTTTLKPHNELIQETIRQLDKSIQGETNISYKTIYSHLSKRFKADKESFLNRL